MPSPLLVDDPAETEMVGSTDSPTSAPDSPDVQLPADQAAEQVPLEGSQLTTEQESAGVQSPADSQSTQQSIAATPAPAAFTLRAHGKTLTIEGVQRVPGEGLRVPEGAAMQRVQALLSRGLEMETFGRSRIRQLESENTTLHQDRSQAEVHAKAIIDWFDGIRRSPDTLLQAVEQWDRFAPMFDANVQRALLTHERQQWERQQRAHEPTPQERYQQAVESVRQMAAQMVAEELAPKHQLTDAEQKAIQQRLLRRPELYLVEVQGRLAFDDNAFAADVEAEAQAKSTLRQSVGAAEQAAKRNAAVRAGTVPAAMAAPSAAVSPTAQPRDGQGRFRTREEWEAAMSLR